jgi:pyruvate dehydrogenase E2 component (dihydrolipoamide acetyltransferase)
MSSDADRIEYEFPLPDVGEGTSEAVLVEWYVEEGAVIVEDDPLCDIETDKAVVEITAPCSGTVIELRAAPREAVAVGDGLAVIETDSPPTHIVAEDPGAEARNETAAGTGSDAPDGERPQQSAASDERANDTGGRTFASPSTRRYAREVGVDIDDLSGTGPNGRVVRADVDATVADRVGAPTSRESVRGWSDQDLEPAGETDVRSLSETRRTIAANMVRSKQTIPHATSVFEADAEALVAEKERLDDEADVHVTYTPLFLKAVTKGLQACPVMNATVDEEAGEIIEKRYYNVAVAIHTDHGLLVPVIEEADEKSVVELAAELESVVERARDRSLGLEDFQHGTFTLTNTGSHGARSLFGTPVINPPQTGIVGVSGIRDEPVAVDTDTLEVRKRLYLSLSYDHRVVDGVTAGEFMDVLIDGIERPRELLSPD